MLVGEVEKEELLALYTAETTLGIRLKLRNWWQTLEFARRSLVLEDVFNPDIKKSGNTKSQTYGWIIFTDFK